MHDARAVLKAVPCLWIDASRQISGNPEAGPTRAYREPNAGRARLRRGGPDAWVHGPAGTDERPVHVDADEPDYWVPHGALRASLSRRASFGSATVSARAGRCPVARQGGGIAGSVFAYDHVHHAVAHTHHAERAGALECGFIDSTIVS